MCVIMITTVLKFFNVTVLHLLCLVLFTFFTIVLVIKIFT